MKCANDAKFIAHARHDISKLVVEVEKLNKALNDIANNNEDSSCNDLALKYEVIAEKALYD